MRIRNHLVALLVLLAGFFAVMAGASEGALEVHFYYSPGCPLCEPTTQVVARAEEKFSESAVFYHHNLAAGEKQYESFIMALEHYGRADTPNLVIFAGDAVLGGGEQISAELEKTIERLLAAGTITPDFAQFGVVDKEVLRVSRSRRTTLWMVLSAGFIDGFNPCAFATVILFVSMLSSVGRDRRTILAVGVSFIVAVFIAYYFIGIAFYGVMQYFDASPSLQFISLAIKWLSLLMVLVAGVLSLVDAWRAWRSGGKEKMLLVLPENLKNSIRKRLRATAHGRSLIIGAFISGIVISFLEAACTGQTYIPIITGLVHDGLSTEEGLWTFIANILRSRGTWMLFLYCVVFIIPLLAVFIAVFLGMTSDQIGNMMRRKVWVTKLALAAVFLLIAVWLGEMLLPTLPFMRQAPSATAPAAQPQSVTPVPPAHPVSDSVDR